MGASTFFDIGKGETAKKAFASLVEQALYEYGHSGYSGTNSCKGPTMASNPRTARSGDAARITRAQVEERVDDLVALNSDIIPALPLPSAAAGKAPLCDIAAPGAQLGQHGLRAGPGELDAIRGTNRGERSGWWRRGRGSRH